jgi:CRP-like cAMP-binding protein
MKQMLRQVMSQTIPVSDDEWAAFEPHIKIKKVQKKNVYIHAGNHCTEIGLLMTGSMRQYHLLPDGERTTFFFFEGDFACDYQSIITNQPATITIEALEDCEVLYFHRDVLLRLYRLYPTYETFGRLIAESVYLCAMERLNTFILNSPEERYRHFLNSAESEQILTRIPQHYIASYLGITPVSLSRIRSRVSRVPRKVAVG